MFSAIIILSKLVQNVCMYILIWNESLYGLSVLKECEICFLLNCRIARLCNEDCVLKGVQFKKGSLVFLFVDTIHHDPNVWTDPSVFNPDRFVR